MSSCLFAGSWERNLSAWTDTPIAASCNLLRISPMFLLSLCLSSYYDTRRFRAITIQSSRITKPADGTQPFASCTPPNSSRKTKMMKTSEPRLPSSPPYDPSPVKRRKWEASGTREVSRSCGWVEELGNNVDVLAFSARKSSRWRSA